MGQVATVQIAAIQIGNIVDLKGAHGAMTHRFNYTLNTNVGSLTVFGANLFQTADGEIFVKQPESKKSSGEGYFASNRPSKELNEALRAAVCEKLSIQLS